MVSVHFILTAINIYGKLDIDEHTLTRTSLSRKVRYPFFRLGNRS